MLFAEGTVNLGLLICNDWGSYSGCFAYVITNDWNIWHALHPDCYRERASRITFLYKLTNKYLCNQP